MNFIDAAGLTDAPVDPYTYAKALSLSGHVIETGRRDAVMRRFRSEWTGHLVYTGQAGRTFWLGAPAYISVHIVPDGGEIPAKSRIDDIAVWHYLHLDGMPLSKARARAKTAKWEREAEALRQDWSDGPVDDLQGMVRIGTDKGPDRPFQYKIVDNLLTFRELGDKLADWHRQGNLGPVGLDAEGTSEDDRISGLVGIGLSFDAANNYYLPLNGPLADSLRELLSIHLKNLRYVAHNSKWDYKILKRNGLPIDLAFLEGDGMIAAYVMADVDEWGRPKPKGLKPLTLEYLGYRQPTFQEMLDQAGAKDAMSAPLDAIAPYCCGDAYFAVELERKLCAEIAARGCRRDIYTNLELPTVIALAEMELAGLPLDLPAATKRRDEYRQRVNSLAANLEGQARESGWQRFASVTCKLHGRKRAEITSCPACNDKGKLDRHVPLNPNSRFHVSEVLQGCFGLPARATTATGDVSNNEVALLQLRQDAGREDVKTFITTLLDYRSNAKLLGTYLENFVEKADTSGAFPVVHARFNQTVVESGRLSSDDPNAQNIPLDERDLFIAPGGQVIWAADYSQLELRILARVAGCRAMIEAFQRDEDIHALTAWRVFGILPANLTDPWRVRAKTLNFGIAYEAQAGAVQKQLQEAILLHPELGLKVPTLDECAKLVAEFWRSYPEVKAAVDFVHYRSRERGFSETMYGRRRYLPMLRHPAQELRLRAERQAWNLVIQGTAGDIAKNSGLMIFRLAPTFEADLRCQVHDELWGLVQYGRKDEWVQVVQHVMVLDQPLQPVPLKVKLVLGPNWKECK